MICTEKTEVNFRVFDLQGREVQEFSTIHIDTGISKKELNLLENLMPGIYFLEARTEQWEPQRKTGSEEVEIKKCPVKSEENGSRLFFQYESFSIGFVYLVFKM